VDIVRKNSLSNTDINRHETSPNSMADKKTSVDNQDYRTEHISQQETHTLIVTTEK